MAVLETPFLFGPGQGHLNGRCADISDVLEAEKNLVRGHSRKGHAPLDDLDAGLVRDDHIDVGHPQAGLVEETRQSRLESQRRELRDPFPVDLEVMIIRMVAGPISAAVGPAEDADDAFARRGRHQARRGPIAEGHCNVLVCILEEEGVAGGSDQKDVLLQARSDEPDRQFARVQERDAAPGQGHALTLQGDPFFAEKALEVGGNVVIDPALDPALEPDGRRVGKEDQAVDLRRLEPRPSDGILAGVCGQALDGLPLPEVSPALHSGQAPDDPGTEIEGSLQVRAGDNAAWQPVSKGPEVDRTDRRVRACLSP